MKDTGYRGIWSHEGSLVTEEPHRYVHYSGGQATCFQQILPMAYYAEKVNRTFFCYGGSRKDKSQILIMASYYCHTTNTVPRPTIVMDKETNDAHDNPSIMLDDAGYIWIFPAAHGTARPAFIYKSREPYNIDAFDLILETNFSYPQPWHIKDKGFLFLHTRYENGRRFLHWMTSADGVHWSAPCLLAATARGHYQISWRWNDKVGTAFNYHPENPKPNDDVGRTNLYYLETNDMGRTWNNAEGQAITVPLTEAKNMALAHNYEDEGLLVYLKDINFDAAGRPVILYVTSRGGRAGPQNDPRTWTTARWTGNKWDIRAVTTSDNNFDTGCLHIEKDGRWRIIGPTEPGPQQYNTGGEIAVWTSSDLGRTWRRERLVTSNSPYNHSYARRPVNAHSDFYAMWADGHARQFSESRIYFCNAAGDRVFQLPYFMTEDICILK